jgi:solute:Na+ symporter, SSS family
MISLNSLPLAAVQMQRIDFIILALYFVVIVGIGIWSGLKRSSKEQSSGYFLAGGTLTWPMIGLALFSTNISTIHMVGFAEEGYKNGLAHGNFEWMAPFLLIVLALFFAPFYLRSRIATLPDFLEQRYCGNCRNWLAFISIISAIFIHICFTLYTGAVVLQGLFGIDIWVSILATAILTGVYTIVGGLLAVVVTGALQTVILLAGSIVITVVAMTKVGGWEGLTANVEPVKLTVLRGSGDASNLPWLSVLLGYPVIGLWYWCADQTIVQRVLGAKDENHARTGPLFAGFLKVLPVFIFFLPGTAYLALVNKGVFPALENTKDCYTYAITNLLPAGWTGLMAAALLAALMSTVSGALNSIATLFSYDLYKRWKPETPDRKLIRIGQMATFVGMVVAVACTRYVESFPTLYQGVNAVISYLAPPITTVFAFGVFWKKASSKAALSTLVAGSLMGAGVFLMDIFKDFTGWKVPFMYSAFFLLVLCSLNMWIMSLVYPHEHTEKSARLVWKNPLEALQSKGWNGLGNYKVLAGILFLVMVSLYIVFASEGTLRFFGLLK